MYKLPYDSGDDDEVNAPSTTKRKQGSASDFKMKSDAKDSKETENENSSRKEERKNVGSYEGNGRYYSLFANENFLTEDTSDGMKKKCCRIGIKSVLLISTVILLIFASMALMWVVRGMQVEQESLKRRIAKLEDNLSTSTSPLHHPSMQQPAAVNPFRHHDTPCCTTNKEQISYLDEVLKGHEHRFNNMEGKLQAYRGAADVRDAQIARNIAENAADIKSVQSDMESVRSTLSDTQKIANVAKELAVFANTKDSSLTEKQIKNHLGEIGGTTTRRGTAFAVARAMGSNYNAEDEAPDDSAADFILNSPPPVAYDVPADFAPFVTFTKDLTSGVEDRDVQPASGTFTIRESGKYFLSVGFCVRTSEETTIQILRNEVPISEFTIAGDSPDAESYSDAMNAPPGFENVMSDNGLHPPPGFEDVMDKNALNQPPAVDNVVNDVTMPMPPIPSDDPFNPAQQAVIRPYQFNDVTSLEVNDELQMKILTGALAEYTYFPGTDVAKSCTRFIGFKL